MCLYTAISLFNTLPFWFWGLLLGSKKEEKSIGTCTADALAASDGVLVGADSTHRSCSQEECEASDRAVRPCVVCCVLCVDGKEGSLRREGRKEEEKGRKEKGKTERRGGR